MGKRRRIVWILLTVLALLSSACETVTVVRDLQASGTAGSPTWEAAQNYYLWGLIGENDIYLDKICKDRPATSVVVQTTFMDGLFSLLVLGIYSPRTVKVWCAKDAI
jgi:hypothetical protein